MGRRLTTFYPTHPSDMIFKGTTPVYDYEFSSSIDTGLDKF